MFDWLKRLFQKLRPPQGRTPTQLAQWLDVPEETLQPWINGSATGHYYRTFQVPKRNRRGYRQIDAPNDRLKALQRKVYHKLLKSLPVHPAAMGFVPGKSIADNARPHVRQEVVVNIDLQDFFPSTKAERVRRYWQAIGWGETAVAILTNICCYQDRLPQGAPTSPALSNVLNFQLDTRLANLAKRCGAIYTRYADDLTFSFVRYRRNGRFLLHHLPGILAEYGYQIQKKKRIRVQRPHQRQTVTGLVVNDALHLPRTVRRQIRAMRHCREQNRLSGTELSRLEGYEALFKMLDKPQ